MLHSQSAQLVRWGYLHRLFVIYKHHKLQNISESKRNICLNPNTSYHRESGFNWSWTETVRTGSGDVIPLQMSRCLISKCQWGNVRDVWVYLATEIVPLRARSSLFSLCEVSQTQQIFHRSFRITFKGPQIQCWQRGVKNPHRLRARTPGPQPLSCEPQLTVTQRFFCPPDVSQCCQWLVWVRLTGWQRQTGP